MLPVLIFSIRINKYLAIISFVLLYSCQSTSSDTTNSTLGLDNVPLELAGTWQMDIDSLTAKDAIKYQYYWEADREYFVMLNHLEPSIQIYGLESSQMIEKIPLENDGPNGIGNLSYITHASFFVESLNSFWIYNYAGSQFFNLNRNGEITRKILPEELFDFVPEGYHKNNLWVKDGYLYAIGNVIYKAHGSLSGDSDSNPPVKTLMIYDLDKDSAQFTFPHPEVFRGRSLSASDIVYYLDFDTSKGKYLISFPSFSDVLLTSDFQELESVPFSKNGVGDLFSAYQSDFNNPTWYLTTDRYQSVNYDPYRDWYIRVFKAAIPRSQYEEGDNVLSTKSRKYFLVYDSNFNPLFEWDVTNLQYWDFFFGEKGIYVGAGGENDVNEDKKTYLIFKPINP